MKKAVDLSIHVPRFRIKIKDKLHDELVDCCTSISVNKNINGQPSAFTMVLVDKRDRSTQQFQLFETFISSNGSLFKNDELFEIYFGYRDKLTKVITANLKSVSMSGFSEDIQLLTLVGYDASYKYLIDRSMGVAND